MAKKRKLDPISEPNTTSDDILSETTTTTDIPYDTETKPKVQTLVEYKPQMSPSDDDEDDESSPEPIRNLLEPLTKDQLIELLSSAASAHPDVVFMLRKTANLDPAHRKIFVHGLGYDTDLEILLSVFKEYGEIEDCNIVKDKNTGKCKGYAFILFKKMSAARRAIAEPQKRIGTRMTACQMASVGPVAGGGGTVVAAPPVSEYTQRKIYVSNVGEGLDPQKLLAFFRQYGEIEEGPLGLDKVTGKPRGFMLFVYRNVESAKKALEEPHKKFEGHILHCQQAIDGPKPFKQGWLPNFQQQQQVGWNQHQNWGGQNQGYSGIRAGALGGQVLQFSRAGENIGFAGIGGPISTQQPGHLMAPSGGGLGFNYGSPPASAAIGQALTALLQLGSLGSSGIMRPVGNQGMQPQMVNSGGIRVQGSYGTQPPGVGASMTGTGIGGYGGQPQVQNGYSPTQMGGGGAGRGQQAGYSGGAPPHVGH